MALVRTYYNPYRSKIKKAQNGMVISSENAINLAPLEDMSKKEQRLQKRFEKKTKRLEDKIKKEQSVEEYFSGGTVSKYYNGGVASTNINLQQPKTDEIDKKFQDQPSTTAGLNIPEGAKDVTGMLKGGAGDVAKKGVTGDAVSGGIGGVAQIAQMGIEAFENPEKQNLRRKSRMNTAKGALSGAAAGAAAGAAFGPWGAAAGAIIGGTFSAIKAKKEHRAMVKEMRADRVREDQEARKVASKEAQQASNQYLAGLNAQSPSNPYTTPGIKSMKSGGIVAELTGGEYIVPKNWDEAITRASESGDDQLAANIYSMAPKQKTEGKFSHKENPIYVYADGETEDEDGNSDVYAPEGSGVYNPSQHKRMKKGKVKEVMVEQKTKGNR